MPRHPAPAPNPSPAPHPARGALAVAPALVLTLALALLAAAPAPALAAAYEPGQRVEVKGLVTGPDGLPLDDVQVVLELARETFSFRTFHKVKKKVTPVATTTNAKGEYSIAFPWDDYYNSFELVVGVPVRGPDGDRFTELQRLDLTRRVQKGSPVVATAVVDNAEFVRTLRKFLADLDTDDEQSVYQEMGRPDRVKVTRYPDHDETAWWYFASGRVYRFVDGKLQSSERFEPVKSFGQ